MNITILLSGGVGSRLGYDTPKQYINVGGQMIVTKTIKGILDNSCVDALYIVADERWHSVISEEIWACDVYAVRFDKLFGGFSSPGRNRQLSIYNALCDMADNVSDDDVVLVQDAVRPLTSQDTLTKCFTAIEGHDGALPVLPMKDTVYISENGRNISSLLDRSHVYAGQAPEAYRYGVYRRANEALLPDDIMRINGAAEPAIMACMDVVMFPGDEGNFKITTQEDLMRYTDIAVAKHTTDYSGGIE